MTLTFKQWVEWKAKAIACAVGFTLAGLLEGLVVDPTTAKTFEALVPEPYTPFVPIVLAGIAGTFGVHQATNVTPTSKSAASPTAAAEPATDTTIVDLSRASGGEYAGPAAH